MNLKTSILLMIIGGEIHKIIDFIRRMITKKIEIKETVTNSAIYLMLRITMIVLTSLLITKIYLNGE